MQFIDSVVRENPSSCDDGVLFMGVFSSVNLDTLLEASSVYLHYGKENNIVMCIDCICCVISFIT